MTDHGLSLVDEKLEMLTALRENVERGTLEAFRNEANTLCFRMTPDGERRVQEMLADSDE